MASPLTTGTRQRLPAFARRLPGPFPDPRRRRFLTDLAQDYARHLEGRGCARGGPDPGGRTAPGYAPFGAGARAGRRPLFPPRAALLETRAGAPAGAGAEAERHLPACHEAVAAGGHAAAVPVFLPGVSDQEFLPVAGWRYPDGERPRPPPASPPARGRGRAARWLGKAYRRRWGAEGATRGAEQQLESGSSSVRSRRATRRLAWLAWWALWWRNLWGEGSSARRRASLADPPRRLRKQVTDLFGGIATMPRELLHPHPNLNYTPRDTG
jgi:hypothetical protein